MKPRSLGPLLLAALTGGLVGPVHANPLDDLGWTPRGQATGGALVADAGGLPGLFYNAAAPALNERPRLGLGWGGAAIRARLDGLDPKPQSPHGTSLALALPIRFFRATFALGAVFYLPDQSLARIHFQPAAAPQLWRLEGNLHHLVVHVTLALRVGWFALGGGASILADADGNGVRFDVGILGGEKTGRAALDVKLPLRAAALVGLWLNPHRRFRLGAQFRDQLDLRLRLDILANVRVTDAISGDALVSLRSASFYTPRKISVGASFDLPRQTRLHLAYDWLGWHSFSEPVPELRVLVALAISPSLLDAIVPSSRFSDAHVARLGVEHQRSLSDKLGLTLRAGYHYASSPVPEQRGLTSFADNDRHTVGLGVGLELRQLLSILPRPLRLDAALSLAVLPERVHHKAAPLLGEGFRSSGLLVGGSLMAELEL